MDRDAYTSIRVGVGTQITPTIPEQICSVLGTHTFWSPEESLLAMAEELAMSRKLASCEKVIKQAIEQASDTLPRDKFLTRQVTHIREVWEEYEEGTLKLVEVGSQKHQDSYRRAFDRAHYNFKIVRQQAETFLERFHEPKVKEEPEYPALAASMERELTATVKNLEEELTDTEEDVEKTPTDTLWNHVESLLRAVEDKLAKALISTREAARLAPDRADSLFENYHKVKRDSLV